jgi:O-antigen ligase
MVSSTFLILTKNNDRGLYFSSEGYPVFFSSVGLSGRNFGIFSHPNVLGQCATISLLFILFSRTNKLAVVFPILCIVKCGSRSAIIGIVVAVMVYAFAKVFEGKKVFQKRPTEYPYVVGTLIMGILLASVYQFITLVAYLDPGSLTGRVSIWQSSLEIVKESSLFGLGWGWSDRAIESQLLNVWASSAHNAVLEFAFSTGIVGLAIFMLLISKGFAYFGNLTSLEKSLFISLFVTGFTESYIDLQYPTIQTYLLFAIIVTSHLREGHTGE